MPYGNGGILGGDDPTTTGAPGVWTAQEIARAKTLGNWPTLKDSDFSSVMMLCHFNGRNGEEGFDNRGSAQALKNANASTRVQLSNAVAKFGKTSLKGDSTGYAQVASAGVSGWGFGTGDFTVEFWIYLTSLAASTYLFDMRPGGANGNYVLLYVKTDGTLAYWLNSADRITSSAGAITTYAWFNVALSRVGGTSRMFINGTQVGSNFSDSASHDTGAPTVLAGGGGTGKAAGYIDELRITKGVGRYSSNFTPQTVPFPDY